MSSAEAKVDLGFFDDDFEDWELESRHFPSKVGGKPAWLDLKNLPKPSQLQCKKCSKPMAFLLQLYCPDNKVTHGFHRTIFMFICTSSACWSDSPPILVLRSQLARQNPFYPHESPENNPTWRSDITPAAHSTLCPVCGCMADKSCAKCRGVSYCSESHQRLDWKAGHKLKCKDGFKGNGTSEASISFLLKEGIMEQEPEPEEGEREAPEGEVEEKYKELIEKGEGGELAEVEDDQLEEVERDQVEDIAMDKFKSRVARAKDQILRYDRGGKPLLCSKQSVLKVPDQCQCGANRSMEFQVMPQLLSELGLGLDIADVGLDWGSIYVFTCQSSCQPTGYVKEHCQLLNFDNINTP